VLAVAWPLLAGLPSVTTPLPAFSLPLPGEAARFPPLIVIDPGSFPGDLEGVEDDDRRWGSLEIPSAITSRTGPASDFADVTSPCLAFGGSLDEGEGSAVVAARDGAVEEGFGGRLGSFRRREGCEVDLSALELGLGMPYSLVEKARQAK
jgi:hypothetical protein